MDKAVAANLMELGDAEDVAQVAGGIAEQSAFAVPKDKLEDRWISCMEVTNSLVDPKRMQRIHLPYMPQLATLSTRLGRRLVLSKRDARHYFHVLRNGKRWRPYMCQPAVRKHHVKKYPLLRAWPMGFRNSAIIAHRVTDAAAHAADLPTECRFTPAQATPLEPPLWATCIDDFVALHYDDDPVGVDWAQRLEDAWAEINVTSHPGKKLDAVPNQEMLGLQVGPDDHVLSLTPAKEWELMQMVLLVASRREYAIASLGRVVGKCNFAHALRPAMRSIFWMSYRVLAGARDLERRRVGASMEVILELVSAALLLPLCRMSLQMPWCNRVVAHDAAPGGHGLAYTELPPGDAQLWARWACHRGDFFLLEDDSRWLHVPRTGTTPLETVDLSLHRFFWHTVPKPGGFKHICLEEFDAYVWALTERLHRRDENSRRCLHLGDNSAQVFAKAKGRSSTWLMNVRCRRVLALELAGDIVGFMIYVPSAKNPSDKASRIFARHGPGRSGSAAPADVAEKLSSLDS